ncbi:seleno S [Brachionus plicatilis]|uniref:Seleno S n=1 Tax=Brachionus plicatilis TaxID=10195 RepID=A0A3M7T7E5_BRAPC|nr:seleno S [Brachionus plicatilis]
MDDDGHIMIDEDDQQVTFGSQIGLFSLVFSKISLIISFLQSNGWFILFACIAIYFLYSRLKAKIPNLTSINRDKKNEEEELENLMKIAEARRRQQEAFDAAKQKYLEEKKKKEEELAQKKIEEYERQKQGLSSKSKDSKNSDDFSSLGLSSSKLQKKSRLRNDNFNPLMGSNTSGGSCSFRPGRRPGPRSG